MFIPAVARDAVLILDSSEELIDSGEDLDRAAGVAVVLARAPEVDKETGQYTCSVPHGWTGTLTPSSNGNVFTPAERSYANVVADQGTQDYTAQSGGARLSYIHTDHLNTPRLVVRWNDRWCSA